MVKKVPSIIATALLAAFLSGNAAAATEQEAHAQLDRIPAKAADARQTAHTVLSDLVSAGVPVDQAYEVVRSGLEKNFSASDLRLVGGEVREQVQKGIASEQVTQTADRAINADYSAAATLNALNTFQARVERGMPASQAYTSISSEIGASAGAGLGAGMGASAGAGMGAGMGASTGAGLGAGMGASAGAGMGAGMGASTGAGMGAGMGASAGAGMGAGMGASTGAGMGAGMGASAGAGMGAGMGAGASAGIGAGAAGMAVNAGAGMGASAGGGASMGAGSR